MKEEKKNVCSRILTPKQVGPICWFMATFVAMFYSQRSRKLLLEASNAWDTKKGAFTLFLNNKKKLFTLLKHVLDDKYLKVESRESDDYKKFSDNTFRNILSYLYIENKKNFPYDPKTVRIGFYPEVYIGKLYKLLNVDYKMFNYSIEDNTVAYSYHNEDYDILNYTIIKNNVKLDFNIEEIIKLKKYKYVENNYAPPILIIKVDVNKKHGIFNNILPSNIINDGDVKNQLKSMREQITYNGKEYNLDSVILTNWNINQKNGHAIAGITCKKNKYVYNGWTRTSMDPVMAKNIARKIPCELMKYNWDIIKNNDFCLNTKKCIPELLKKKLKVKDICFNFSKGSKLLIYVRKDAKPDTSIESNTNIVNSPIKSPKKCPEGKVLNPKTGRCILIKNAKTAMNKSPKSLKSPKKCPEGKVLNPKTGRCILIKNAKVLINKSPKSPKKCPEGKVLNPKTGRCILIKNKNNIITLL
jgi:nucleoid DNA-binding protein